MDLNEISVFIKVVQAGSFRLAAKQLGMPNSTVSAKISSLEKRLGSTLIQRTTRKLKITEVGQSYYLKCLEGLEHIKNAEAEVNDHQEAQGLLRITAPVELGASFFPRLSSQFLKEHPKVTLDYLLTDLAVDLLSENVDLAIRAGNLKVSSLIAKKIGTVHFALFASPSYLKVHGSPKEPKDLSEHACLHFTQLNEENWKLSSSKSTVIAKIKQKIRSNDLNMLKALTMSGEGIALLPAFLCLEETQKNKMLRILPEWKSHAQPVHFVYPPQKFISPKLKSFIQYAFDPLKQFLQASTS